MSLVYHRRMALPAPRTTRLTADDLVALVKGPAVLALLLLEIGFLGSYFGSPFTWWFFFNSLLFPLMTFMALVAHEAAHALVGRAVGLRPFRINLGYGAPLFKVNLGGCRIAVHTFFLTGFVFFVLDSKRALRARLAIATAAGPLCNLALLLLVGVVGAPHVPAFHYNGLREGIALVPLFQLGNAILLLGSLPPVRINTARGLVGTDAWTILTLAFGVGDTIEDLKIAHEGTAAIEHAFAGRFEEALACWERALALAPDSYAAALNRVGMLLELDRYEEARAASLDLLARSTPIPFQRAIAANNLAWANVMVGHPELLAQADTLSKESLTGFPKVGAFKGTRGYVLIRTGCLDEGIALSREALRITTESRHRAANACAIAIGLQRKGACEEALEYLGLARDLDPDCRLLALVPTGKAASEAEPMAS